MKLPSFSFLIPAYNDADTIEKLVIDAIAVGKTITDSLEVVVVDDASRDKTAEVLASLVERFPRIVRVITHVQNQGYGGAIKALYYEGKGEWLFTVPGDYQIDPKEALTLIPYSNKADMIVGRRVSRQDSIERIRQSKIYNSLIQLLFQLPIHDVNSVRLLRSSVMRNVRLTTASAFVDAELAIRMHRMDYRIVEAPIGHKTREGSIGGGGKLRTILPTIADMIRFFILGN
jgi:glycosyltransferase involved in cell wall biosynthesis